MQLKRFEKVLELEIVDQKKMGSSKAIEVW